MPRIDSAFLRRCAPAVAVFGCTLALRLVALWRLSHTPYAEPVTADMEFYAEWAKRIAGGQWTDFHAFYGQPLYAYVLGGIFSITGFQPVLMGAFQAVLDALTALLIFQIARLLFKEAPRYGAVIGAFAVAGWAFFVPAAAYSLLLIPVSWMVVAWWFCLWWLLRRGADALPAEWLLLGAFAGAMAMISATFLFVVPLFLARAFVRRSLAAPIAIAVGVLAGTAPAWLHNAVIARDPVFLSAHSGLNFWIGNNPEANGYPRVPRELPSEQAGLLRESIALAESAAGRPLKRSEVSAYWSGKARKYIVSHPTDWFWLLGVKAKNFWNRFVYDDLSSITALRDAGVVLPGLSFGLLAAIGLPGCIVAWRIPPARWIVAAVVLQLIALLPVFVNERYRLSAAPGLLLVAAIFLAELWRAFVATNWRRVAVQMSLLVASTWFVTLSPGEPALWSLDDYKTAKRQLLAEDYARAESRLRRAWERMVPTSQVPAAVARGFGESAREKSAGGDAEAALATVDHAIRINPTDESLSALRRRITDAREAKQD